MNESSTHHNQMLPAWWGEIRFAPGEQRLWEIASLRMRVERGAHEWHIRFREGEPCELGATRCGVDAQGEIGGEENAIEERYLFRRTGESLWLSPALAPRKVVVRPLTPLRVPAGERVSLFVTTPIWIQFRIAKEAKLFRELAMERPSDTWFGPNTRTGELCYAARTPGRLEFEALQPEPQSAVTCVDIRNDSDEMLTFDRVNLPVTYLGLYRDAYNRLWTPTISLIQEEQGELAKVEIGNEPPPMVPRTVHLSGAREQAQEGLLVRAFQALFD